MNNSKAQFSIFAEAVVARLARVAKLGAYASALACGAVGFTASAQLTEERPLDLVEQVLAEGRAKTSASEASAATKFTGDFNVSVYGEGEYDSFLGKSELWADNWGLSAQLKQNDQSDFVGLPKDSSFFNLDVKRRFGSQDKSNIELGLGWQELNIESQLEASGPKVSLAGKYNLLKDFQVYGSTSYFPELEDQLKANSTLSAYEFEAGLLYKPLPSMSVKAGYRVFNLELEDPVLQELGSTSGFLLGTDLSW